VGVALPLAEGGRIRILAAGAANRAARTPEVPSFIESGVKDFNVGTWFAMLAPRGTPREVRAKLYADIAALLKEPAVAELMLKQGMTPAGGTPEELHDLIRSDFERWTRIVREANIKAD
jgi:tripartite-type tricarboxylate transporter receptor subunit TctC